MGYISRIMNTMDAEQTFGILLKKIKSKYDSAKNHAFVKKVWFFYSGCSDGRL